MHLARSFRGAFVDRCVRFCVSEGMFQALPLPRVLTSTSSLPEEEKLKPVTDLNKGGKVLFYINTLYSLKDEILSF